MSQLPAGSVGVCVCKRSIKGSSFLNDMSPIYYWPLCRLKVWWQGMSSIWAVCSALLLVMQSSFESAVLLVILHLCLEMHTHIIFVYGWFMLSERHKRWGIYPAPPTNDSNSHYSHNCRGVGFTLNRQVHCSFVKINKQSEKTTNNINVWF